MSLIPDPHIGWLNGWIPIALLGLTDGIVFLLFPRDVVQRLFDRSGWPKKKVILTVISKVVALGCLILLIFSPIKSYSFLFPLGLSIVVLGLVGMVVALINFKNTPPGEPVSRGIYKISRHPQIVMSSLVLLGACMMVGSWAALILLISARVLGHFSILAEEQVCLKTYGQDYRKYMDQVPRYFLFF